MMWEYKIEDTQWLVTWELTKRLDRFGREGWELVAVTEHLVGLNRFNTYFFKRPRWKACECGKTMTKIEEPKDREQDLIQEMRQGFLDTWIELKDAVLDDDIVLALKIAEGLLEKQ